MQIAPLPAPVRPDPVRDRWHELMRLAIDEAALATATGDVPVGALVLGPDGTVVGRGHNEREALGDPTAHAEVVAIRQAAEHLNAAARSASGEGGGGRRAGEWRLSGCTLVVTLEPCTMCAGAIVLSRLDRVVYGAFDDKAGAAGSLFDVVRDRRLNHRPEVVSGVLAEDCSAQLLAFFDTQR
ncbi:tRNA-specific adenosine deaminase [Kitasatospora sp. MMS16-BH015]|uniref:nucleoside deaminase n=1 Tax=Kitasatospora sp. MMS16-BH015 TaxID=2018025 RepID=UPI000CA0CCD2|nr:nucleoside deaminase [Kitasatospora sp. MMS16-BH015]AUG78363.1 tRNA-specific adenosine deaminase [Kitasatospora sp. MMS16-BH015]